ncbi:MAG TPA: hypothetical protein VMZ25_02360 [Terriglobales bacterium]|nr:hypothetical protein [Terriglobales bacterium]
MREVIHHWWIFGLRSLLAIALAAAIFLLQAWAKFSLLDAVTIPFMIIALSLYGILDSFLLIYQGMQFPSHSPARPISITQGICGGAIGAILLTVLFRAAELRWFLYLITAQAAITGFFEVLSGLRFTGHLRDEWACFAAGAASMGFAVLLQATTVSNTEHALSWFLGYALLLAASMGWFSLRLRTLNRELPRLHEGQSKATAAV